MTGRLLWRPLWLVLFAAMAGGCVHGTVPHDYVVDLRGTLMDGTKNRPIEGARVTVKVGDKVIYDGRTDGDGALAFTYRTRVYRQSACVEPQESVGVTVTFEVDAGRHGVVTVPVTIGEKTDVVRLGEIRLRRTER